jgi:3-hydroxyisobutyrate dehydrogenase-like beta-hydroxyacid dehydrogenase
MAEDYIAQTGEALCGVMAAALIEKGVPSLIARALSERACKPAARAGASQVVSTAKKAVKKLVVHTIVNTKQRLRNLHLSIN